MATFAGVSFRELVDDSGFVALFDEDANIDEQPTGENVNFDIGNPPAPTLTINVECTAVQLSSLRSKKGVQGVLSVGGTSRAAILKGLRGVQSHAIHDLCRLTLTFLGA